jgi:hypothetical protein
MPVIVVLVIWTSLPYAMLIEIPGGETDKGEKRTGRRTLLRMLYGSFGSKGSLGVAAVAIGFRGATSRFSMSSIL